MRKKVETNRRRNKAFKVGFMILGFLALHCSNIQEPSQIRLSLNGNPPTLDWNLATDNISYQVLTQLMEGLTQYDQEARTVPAIARSWDVLEEGHKYVFHLDPSYKWSDGKTVAAQDFVDSWVRLLKPATASEYAYFLFDIRGAKDFNAGKTTDPASMGLRALDALTLEVTLDKPIAFFPSLLSFMVTYPIRQDLIDKYGDQWTHPRHLITCGPFQLEDFWPEYRLVLTPNPYYGGQPKPALKKIRFFVVPEATTALTLAESGLLDVAPIPPLALDQFKNDAHLVRQPKLRGYYFGFQVHQAPFDNPGLRKALAHSLNKAELPHILKGGEMPLDSWIPPPLLGFTQEAGLKFDLQKARDHLKQSGFDPTQRLSFFFNSDATNKKIAEWAQGQWKKHLGLTVELKNMEWKAYLSFLHNDPPGFFRMGWGADYPDPDNFMNLFTSASGNNYTGYRDPAFDALVSRAAGTADRSERETLYTRAQKKLLEEDAVIIPLFTASQYLWVRDGFRPYPITPMDFAYLKRVHALVP